MPNIVGRDLQDATAMLEVAGVIDLSQIGYFGTWPLNVTWETDTAVEPNVVLSQYPSAGGDVSGYVELFDIGTSAALDSVALVDSGGGAAEYSCPFTAGLTGWGLVATDVDVTAPAFAFATGAPAPSGYGFLVQTSSDGPLPPDQYYSAYVTASSTYLRIWVQGCNVTGDIYLRFWRYASDSQTFDLLAQLEAASVTLNNETVVKITDWTQIENNQLYFGPDDWLFIDVVANITANVSAAGTPAILLGAGLGADALGVYMSKAGPNIVGVNATVDLTVSSLPVSVIYP